MSPPLVSEASVFAHYSPRTIKVGARKTKATVKSLEKGKKVRVEVRPMRKCSGKTYDGMPSGAWATSKSAPIKVAAASKGWVWR